MLPARRSHASHQAAKPMRGKFIELRLWRLVLRRQHHAFKLADTPKALANGSPGLLQPWVTSCTHLFNSEGVPIANQTLSAFYFSFNCFPGLSLALTLGWN